MSEQDIEAMKRNIDAQLAEYEVAIREAVVWYRGWQERQRCIGFRCVQDATSEGR